jgi:hypothetical protein
LMADLYLMIVEATIQPPTGPAGPAAVR